MRQFICALATLLVVGCWEADPDQDSMGELRAIVQNFSGPVRQTMAKWQANTIARGYLLAKRIDSPIGYIDCPGAGRHPMFVRDMLACLVRRSTSTYDECFGHMLRQFYDETDLILPDACKWTHLPEFDPGNMPDEFQPDMNADFAALLLGPPPPIEIQLMLMGLPGVMGPGGALCIQVKRDWACAPDPFEDTPGTTSAAAGGGDR